MKNVTTKKNGKKWSKYIFNNVIENEDHQIEKKRPYQDERDAYKLALIALKKPFLIEN